MKLYPPKNEDEAFYEINRMYLINTAKLREESWLTPLSKEEKEYYKL